MSERASVLGLRFSSPRSDASGVYHHKTRRLPPAYSIGGHMLRTARLFEAQAAATAKSALRPEAHDEASEPLAKHIRLNSERVANAVKRKWVAAAMSRDPLASLGKGPPFTRAAHTIPALKNIDGIDQHREHKALLCA
jgi:hypothetical protein